MTANPILAEAVRGNWVENRHRGAAIVVDASGRVIAAAGDVDRPIFPRSAIKSMQALAIFTSGAWAKGSLGKADLALASASHLGEAIHTEGVAALLARLDLDEANLECGAHPPNDADSRSALRKIGTPPSQLHNNCSGKHAGMLSVARALDVDPKGYVERDHPVQKAVRAAVEEVLGESLTADRCGTDGCSIPTYAASLHAFARGFARMATGEGLEPEIAEGAWIVFDAATGHPQLVAGTGHPDTRLMAAFGDRLMQKGGAEGVQCGAIRDKGWGYALKCDDGNMSASHAMLAGLLAQIADPDRDQQTLLDELAHQPVRNVRGAVVGEMRAADPFALEWT